MDIDQQKIKQSNKKIRLIQETVKLPLEYIQNQGTRGKVKQGIDVKFSEPDKEANEINATFFASNFNLNENERNLIKNDINETINNLPVISDRVRNLGELNRIIPIEQQNRNNILRKFEINNFSQNKEEWTNIIERKHKDLDFLLSHFDNNNNNNSSIIIQK